MGVLLHPILSSTLHYTKNCDDRHMAMAITLEESDSFRLFLYLMHESQNFAKQALFGNAYDDEIFSI